MFYFVTWVEWCFEGGTCTGEFGECRASPKRRSSNAAALRECWAAKRPSRAQVLRI